MTHRHLNQIAYVTQRASELRGDTLETFIFRAWWQYPHARRALADTLNMPLFVLRMVCEGKMA